MMWPVAERKLKPVPKTPEQSPPNQSKRVHTESIAAAEKIRNSAESKKGAVLTKPSEKDSVPVSVAPWRQARHPGRTGTVDAESRPKVIITPSKGPGAGEFTVDHEENIEHHYFSPAGSPSSGQPLPTSVVVRPGEEVTVYMSPSGNQMVRDKRSHANTIHGVSASLPVDTRLKDFSKTAPWRVQKQQTMPRDSSLYPWRVNPEQFEGASIHSSQAPPPSVTITDSHATSRVQPSLTFVGKRIESPSMGSPITGPGQLFPVESGSLPTGRATTLPSASNSVPQSHTLPSTSDPSRMLKPSNIDAEHHSPRSEDIHFSAAAPDLVDIPMPAVKKMVADLNRRLHAIAVQHPKIIEPAMTQEMGLNYFKKSDSPDAHGWRIRNQPLLSFPEGEEILIDMPPNEDCIGTALQVIKEHLFGAEAAAQYPQGFMDMSAVPRPHHRRFSLPGGAVAERVLQPRRVRFAEPVETSVIEIEPRKPRPRDRRRRPHLNEADECMSDIEDYTLSRTPRNLGTGPPSRRVPPTNPSLSHDPVQLKPAESFPEKVVGLEDPRKNAPPAAGGIPGGSPQMMRSVPPGVPQNFSFSLGDDQPGTIHLSVMQRGDGQPTELSFSIPPEEGHYVYSISSKPGVEPVSIRYTLLPKAQQQHQQQQQQPKTALPPKVQQQPQPKAIPVQHARAPSLDSARTVHIQYPPGPADSPVQTGYLHGSGSPLSPPRQTLGYRSRSPSNYSNTLQIDTSSKYQHPRSPPPPYSSLSPNANQAGPGRLSPQLVSHQPLRLQSVPPRRDNGHPGQNPSPVAPSRLSPNAAASPILSMETNQVQGKMTMSFTSLYARVLVPIFNLHVHVIRYTICYTTI